jgi:hypothetical protein
MHVSNGETFEVDLSGYINTQGSILPPGTYTLVVEDVEMMSSKAGNPMWKITSSVVEGESKGLALVDFVTITSKAMFRVVAFLNAIGVPTPKKSLSIPKSMMVGKMFEATVDDDEYGGRKSSKIQSYASIAQPGAGDLPDDDEGPTGPEETETLSNTPDGDDEADDAARRADQLDEEVNEQFAEAVTEPKAAPKTNARQQPAKPVDDDLDL